MRKSNHLAILVLVIFQQVLGFVWYSRFLFGNVWMQAQNKKPEDLNPHNPIPFIASILGSILFCYGLDWIMRKMNWNHPARGAILGALVAVAFILPSLWTHYAFLEISYPVLAIDSVNGLIAAIVTGFVLGIWKSKPVQA